jgi:protein phosphatase
MEHSTCATDSGSMRERNEDALLCMPEQHIYMVADGVGGHNAGDKASDMAVQTLRQRILETPPNLCDDEDRLMDYFLELLNEVNDRIAKSGEERADQAGMATTAVILYLCRERAYVINVGDSRAYLYRDRQLRQITEDHTFVNELIKNGAITKEEAELHPKRNMITRALGGEKKLQPDFYRFDVFSGDRLLLCTDGLYNELTEEEIRDVFETTSSTEAMSEQLVRRANENGGSDNITVVCVAV